MMELNCFAGGTVISELESSDKIDAIKELVHKAPIFEKLIAASGFEQSLMRRERLQSTGFGHGVAVAHGRVPSLESVVIALGISHKGIEFDSIDGEPVKLLFLIISPPELQYEYLVALSVLVRLLRDEGFRDMLLAAGGAEDVEKKLNAAFTTLLRQTLNHSH